jgi:hypothetical protein
LSVGLPDRSVHGIGEHCQAAPAFLNWQEESGRHIRRPKRAVEMCQPHNQKQKIISAPFGRVHLDQLADRADFALGCQPNQIGKNNLEITLRLRTIPLGVFQRFLCKTIRKG